MKELADGSPSKAKPRSRRSCALYAEWIDDRAARSRICPFATRPQPSGTWQPCRDALLAHAGRLVPGAERPDGSSGVPARQLRDALPAGAVATSRLATSIKDKQGVYRAGGCSPAPRIQTQRAAGWRPFQIAFILASLPELVDPTPSRPHARRPDLLPDRWWQDRGVPRCLAICLLARRLRNPEDAGTDTLMRYTLRLLTAQQFLRAASLICVLEDIRSEHRGRARRRRRSVSAIWLGGDSTPNTWKRRVEVLEGAAPQPAEPEPLPAAACPWCGTQMGTKPKGRGGQDVIGYEQVGRTGSSCAASTRSAGTRRRAGLARPRRRRGHLRRASLDRDRHGRQVRHDGLAPEGPEPVRAR